MVMKRYPHGAAGQFFFMKRAPSPRPDWIEICSIDHGSENIIDFPMIQDRAALLWVINLGCIDLNQWYATCDDVNRPDYVHFDLDPGPGATFEKVLETALVVHEALETLKMPSVVKTTGSRRIARLRADRPRPGAEAGMDVCQGARARTRVAESSADHVGVPCREPAERAGAGRLQPEPMGQHARVDLSRCGRGLSATVSTPVSWKEVERGVRIEDFTVKNVPETGRHARRPVEAAARRARTIQPRRVRV